MRTVVACAGAILGAVLLLPILVIAVPLWMVSACTRAFGRMLESSYVTRDQLIQFDPHFGWKPRPNLRTHHLMGDLFRISTDGDGWRGRSTVDESDIVVFGDSFAAGYGVDDDQCFADLNTRLRIKPVGIGGYSMVQSLLWMERLADGLRGKLVVWFVYLGNDLYDNLSPELRGYRKPFVRERKPLGGWEVVSSHITEQKWPIAARSRRDHVHMVSLAELCSNTFLAERAFNACGYLIERAGRVCREMGADLVVMTVPDQHQLSPEGRTYLRSLIPDGADFDADRPDQRIASICTELEIPVIAGSRFLDPSCYKSNDCHWNEVGHEKVAAQLAELYASRSTALRHAVRNNEVEARLERVVERTAPDAIAQPLVHSREWR